MHRLIVNSAAAAHAMDSDRQAELIKALSDRIAELQAQVTDLETSLLEYQEAAWIVEELELAAGCDVVVINRVEGRSQLIVRGVLWQGPTLREVAVAAFEKDAA